jgi:hypothetical protein
MSITAITEIRENMAIRPLKVNYLTDRCCPSICIIISYDSSEAYGPESDTILLPDEFQGNIHPSAKRDFDRYAMRGAVIWAELLIPLYVPGMPLIADPSIIFFLVALHSQPAQMQ